MQEWIPCPKVSVSWLRGRPGSTASGGEHLGVAVGGAEGHPQLRTGRQVHAVQPDGRGRRAEQPDPGGVDAEELLGEVVDRRAAALFYRYLFVAGPLDRTFVAGEVDHAVRHLVRLADGR
jgi:hypothetical protein